jgi:hypothetical protein
VPGFELQFPPSLIDELAQRFEETDDSSLLAAGLAARRRGYYRRAEFLAACRWKSPRSASLVAGNTGRAIAGATRHALSPATGERARVEALTSLAGVGVPTASTLLYFAYPDDYPILDVRALESLGRRGRSVYPVSFWLEYLEACRRLALTHGVSIRTLDKALWQHSRERATAPSG